MSDDASKSDPPVARSAPPELTGSARLPSPDFARSAEAASAINPLEHGEDSPQPPAPPPSVNKVHEWAAAVALMLLLSAFLFWFVSFFRTGGFL